MRCELTGDTLGFEGHPHHPLRLPVSEESLPFSLRSVPLESLRVRFPRSVNTEAISVAATPHVAALRGNLAGYVQLWEQHIGNEIKDPQELLHELASDLVYPLYTQVAS